METQMKPTQAEIISHFLPWDLWNFALLVALIILASLPGCAPVKIPVSTFAITKYEEPTESNPPPVTTPESSRGNGILQPKDGAGGGVESPVEIRQYAVRLKVTSGTTQTLTGYGSGVLVDGGVLTAAHVVRMEGTPRIQCEANGQTAYGESYRYNTTADVAFVAVKWKAAQPSATLAKASPGAGESVTSVGRGENGDIDQVSHTVLASTRWDDHSEIELTPTVNQGRSGGGLFNALGELCGIVTAAIVHPRQVGIAVGVDAVSQVYHEGAESNDVGRKYSAWIVCRDNCVPCDVFHGRNGAGSDRLGLRYLNVDKPIPADCPMDIWQAAVAGAAVRGTPFAMWRTRVSVAGQPVGFPTSTACGGMSTADLLPWVAKTGVPE